MIAFFKYLFSYLVNIHHNYLVSIDLGRSLIPAWTCIVFFRTCFTTNVALTDKYCTSFRNFKLLFDVINCIFCHRESYGKHYVGHE
jgi:hypothetical protein